MDTDDYRTAVGSVENGKLVYQIGSVTETSISFNLNSNELTYIEENTQRFVRNVMIETSELG